MQGSPTRTCHLTSLDLCWGHLKGMSYLPREVKGPVTGVHFCLPLACRLSDHWPMPGTAGALAWLVGWF